MAIGLSVVMAVDLVLDPPLSLKERLVGKGPVGSRREIAIIGVEVEDDFDFMEGDITRSIVNDIPLIDFLERVLHFLLQGIGIIVVSKLLGPLDYGKYLIVQSWSIDFNPAQPFPNIVMSWIRLPGLPRLYEHVKEICSNMEPCPRANGSVPSFGGESLTVDAVMVNDDRAKETCAFKPWMLFERKPRLPLGILEETELQIRGYDC
ncbi:hypothetical protein GOBAR_DD31511 [Gossypium barbadense]|nr:hypothetical protein GOBAR_DD31511 [Gossypium barbadense]